jgi:gamma-glutamyltranspeptidase
MRRHLEYTMTGVKPVFGKKAMVVAGHPAAALAAWEVAQAGGSIIDAAVAGAAVLTVVLPQACTLGGDAFALVHDASKRKTYGLNASGPAPRAASSVYYASGIPQRGALSCSVPGIVGGWHALYERFGNLSWARLFDRAIQFCEEGFPVSPGLARAAGVYQKLLAEDAGLRHLFLDRCPSLRPGTLLLQPSLGETFRQVASNGPRAMYEGPIPQSLARVCAERGGILQEEDFAGYTPEWADPIEIEYRGHTVRAMPPNSYGLYLLLQLAALSEQDWSGATLDNPHRLLSLIRAALAAFDVGRSAVADPRFGFQSAVELLGPVGRARLMAKHAEKSRHSSHANRGGTAVISVADSSGNAAIIVQSIFLVFGSSILDPTTGILLNDRMIGFNTEAGHPNCVASGKRPAHTLCPVMVFDRDHALEYVLGTPGGPGQTITLTQVLHNILDLKLNLWDAIAAPRWSMDLGANVVVEAPLPPQIVAAASEAGIPISQAPADSPFFGSAEAIEFHGGGVLCGAADFRREAIVIGA